MGGGGGGEGGGELRRFPVISGPTDRDPLSGTHPAIPLPPIPQPEFLHLLLRCLKNSMFIFKSFFFGEKFL